MRGGRAARFAALMFAATLVLAPLAAPAYADAPASSLRPMPSPFSDAAMPATSPSAQPGPATGADPNIAPTTGLARSLRPMPRPQSLEAAAVLTAAVPTPDLAPDPSPEPLQTKRPKKERASKKGSVCGDPEIKGEALAPIKGKVKGCGLDKPVRVTSISGIRLNQPATFSCDTARAMKSWIENGLRPAMGRREVVEIRVAASYICRSRNNKKGAKISEHGRGRAVDVAGFVFADGSEWSILRDYNRQVRRAHKAACGIFGTTLGPGSDGYHEDHLHFDIAQHRNGAYCR